MGIHDYDTLRVQYMELGLAAKQLKAELETLCKADFMNKPLKFMFDAYVLERKIADLEQRQRELHRRIELALRGESSEI